MGDNEDGDVFQIPDLWRPSVFIDLGWQGNSLLFPELKFDDAELKLPEQTKQAQDDELFFKIPELLLDDADDLSELHSPSEPGENSDDVQNTYDHDLDDIWLLSVNPPVHTAQLLNWDAFDAPTILKTNSPYITEAGDALFDAAAAGDEDYLRIANSEHFTVCSKTYASSLLALGFGRGSALFDWDDDLQSFVPCLPKMRISGYSGEALQNLLRPFMDCGNITRYLQNFVGSCYDRNQTSGQIALADAVSSLLVTIQSRLSLSISMHQSVMQLKMLFQPAHSILTCFKRIIRNVSATRNDEAMLSTIFQEIQLLEHRTDALKAILLEVLLRVSGPWLKFSSEWLGLKMEEGLPVTKEGNGHSFVSVENREWVDEQGLEIREPDFVLDYDRIPSFIAPEDARSMFEVGRSLRFLKAHHASHPLARPEVIATANPPTLSWRFAWHDIAEVETKALQYEQDLIAAINKFSSHGQERVMADDNIQRQGEYNMDLFGKPEEDMQAQIQASIMVLNQSPMDTDPHDNLSITLHEYLTPGGGITKLDDAIFAPPVSLSPILSFKPIIAAQARIVNGTCIRMFFENYNLREHLFLQRKFHLFGDGVFTSRLSHALFDPELESAERHRGVARSGGIMGLRLGGRDTWPPASSELRLALMGVLTDSYTPNKQSERSYAGTFLDQTSLPGDMSFAVRDMSEEEIDKCLNPDSNEALDFLRLSYKAPAPLDAVITPIVLFKYDQVFKLLLRVLRMLYVVCALYRNSMGSARATSAQPVNNVAQRFRIEAHHFVSSVSGYFLETGIETTWRTFERKLDQVEARLSDKVNGFALREHEGLDQLRDYHERVLDKIMFALFLRKRQRPVMNLLEEIFSLILRFSKCSSHTALESDENGDGPNEISKLHATFRKKIGVFISVCRSLSEKKGYGEKGNVGAKSLGHGGLFDGHDLAEENTISHLLTRLEMSNYYSGPVKQ